MSQIPTGLLIDAALKNCEAAGQYYYILQRGNYGSGVILIKMNYLNGTARLELQQRNFMTDMLEWINPLGDSSEPVEEKTVDDYIDRSKSRDPDLWIVEVESQNNPFLEE